MKVRKVLLSTILTVVMVILTISTKTFAAEERTTWKLGAEMVRQGISTRNAEEVNDAKKYSYRINNTRVLKIVDKTDGVTEIEKYKNAIYCLKAGVGFGSEGTAATGGVTISDVTYNRRANMLTDKASLKDELDLSEENYNSILWLLDNIYLPKQTPISERQQERNALLERAFAKAFEGIGIDGSFDNTFEDWTVDRLPLTDDDIEVVQQWAIWHFTNAEEEKFQATPLATIQVSTIGTGAHSPLSDEGEMLGQRKEGDFRQAGAQVLYNYLVTEAGKNTNYSKIPTEIKLNKTLTPTVKQSNNFKSDIIVGPFEITKIGNTAYTFEGLVNENKMGYTICDANGNGISGIRDLETAVGKGQFYIKISKTNLSNIKDIRLKISYTTNDTEAIVWTVDGSTQDQPVVVVEREPKTEEDEISVHIPEFDLSLRKYIVSVTRNGENVIVDELTGRIPTIEKTNLKTRTNGKTETTAKYNHRKDAVPVETGDIVEYVITIYNEGEIAGRATEIIDYLPTGLEFLEASEGSTNYYNYEVSSDKKQITIKAKNNENLAAYNGTTLSTTGEKIKFKCKVTKKAGRNTSEILTNIAEITKAYDVNNVEMNLEGDDRDSTPKTITRPIDANLPSYKGDTNNKPELGDRNYYYKGQEDDDDFEKLKVTTPEFDLSLRKFITHINGIEVESREPDTDVSQLNKNNVTTAEYKHTKEPLIVKRGQTIRYTIRVYNEGDIAGTAPVVTDYLPAGLELAPATTGSINARYGWTGGPSMVQTEYLTGKTIPAFDGTLHYIDTEIECVVSNTATFGKVLTNIAQINADTGDDRDSQVANLTPPAADSSELSNYKGKNSNKADLTDKNYYYEGQQDDDDFEKVLVYTPSFDLSLRKFITQIGENEITDRAPTVDTTPLKNGTGKTAIYKHAKNPLTATVGDTVIYTIRVYNEGEEAGYATEIEDYLPSELEFVENSKINREYHWTKKNGDERTLITDYLKDTPINGYTGGDTLSFADIKIECKVKETSDNDKVLTNIAQINNDSGNDRDSQVNNVRKPSDTDLPNYKGDLDNKENLTDKNYYYVGQQDDDDFEKIKVYKPGFDLALRKFITQIGENEITQRVPTVDTTPLDNKTGETAIYTHPKTPVTVNVGDTVVYTIRVYNEGEANGYATEIEDYLPLELEFVEDSEINREYKWTKKNGDARTITTDYLKDTLIEAYDGGDELSSAYVEIECRVKETENVGKILTNIAQINAAEDEDRNKIVQVGDDRDSLPQNVNKPSDTNLPNYEENQEDDDDYEKVEIYKPEYDLSLRKFITQIEEDEITDREPIVDTTPLTDGSGKTDAKYTHSKKPIVVKSGDTVIYTIRVYNEGKEDAYAEEIKDNIPEGLAYIIDHEINIEYRWSLSEDEKEVSTDYLSKERDEDNILKAYNPETMETLDYKDVKIAFKVIEPDTSTRTIKNIAEIKEDDGKDIDSVPDNDDPDEDDIDEEYIVLKYFDLALRKYITKVESKTRENLPIETDETKDISREPKVEIGEDGKIKYIHPKDPVKVGNTDIVIYTLRVYNEGTVAGFAEEIKDDVPVGLELVPEHEINQKYGWKMYDEEGNETEEVEKAKTIRTTYLAEANGKENEIEAFDRETMTTPAYKEVEVAFRVVSKDIEEDRIVINTAEISKDNNDDVDSEPDNDEPDEDDIDKEYIKVKTFDLSLLKWVSKVMVTENGQTKITETGYNGLENPEPIVKLEIKNSQIKTITIKYEYGIKITNEGEIAGYAKEITDYIPEGLEFVAEDNPLWSLKEDGKIVTTQLENTLLQPGESAIVNVVFKWKNDANNFGMKENIAEISKDENDKEEPDKDSTPDNQKPEEDDQDNAFVILNPKTGGIVVYIVLPTIILGILATGIILIKKYVL